MHICTCAPSYLPDVGGAEVGMHAILRCLSETTHHHFSIITGTNQRGLPPHEVIKGVEIHRYRHPRLWAKSFAPTFNSFRAVPKLIHALKPSLIHISYILPTGLAAWATAKQLQLPIVMSLGGSDVYNPQMAWPFVLRRMAAFCIQRTASVIVNSSVVHRAVVEVFGAGPDTVRRIPFGIDTDRFHPQVNGQTTRKRHGINDDEIVVLAMQRLEKGKGVEVLIAAISKVVVRFPNVRVLIGGSGKEAERLNNLRKALNLEKQVQFCGLIPPDETPSYYAAADISVLASHSETLGIVLAEASAMGLPVVATRAGGTVDVVLDGVSGLLVEPGNPEALANALCELIADPAKRASMGRAGREHVVRHFGLESVASAYLEAFEQAYLMQRRERE